MVSIYSDCRLDDRSRYGHQGAIAYRETHDERECVRLSIHDRRKVSEHNGPWRRPPLLPSLPMLTSQSEPVHGQVVEVRAQACHIGGDDGVEDRGHQPRRQDLAENLTTGARREGEEGGWVAGKRVSLGKDRDGGRDGGGKGQGEEGPAVRLPTLAIK